MGQISNVNISKSKIGKEVLFLVFNRYWKTCIFAPHEFGS